MFILTLSWRRSLSYRNQSIRLQCKSMDWFLYDRVVRHERVKCLFRKQTWKLYLLGFTQNVNEINNYFQLIPKPFNMSSLRTKLFKFYTWQAVIVSLFMEEVTIVLESKIDDYHYALKNIFHVSHSFRSFSTVTVTLISKFQRNILNFIFQEFNSKTIVNLRNLPEICASDEYQDYIRCKILH